MKDCLQVYFFISFVAQRAGSKKLDVKVVTVIILHVVSEGSQTSSLAAPALCPLTAAWVGPCPFVPTLCS